jgi:hypothetical protein
MGGEEGGRQGRRPGPADYLRRPGQARKGETPGGVGQRIRGLGSPSISASSEAVGYAAVAAGGMAAGIAVAFASMYPR